MKPLIDCLFIGYNEGSLEDYEKNLRKMGTGSGAYRDLNLSILWYHHKPYSAAGIYNLLAPGHSGLDGQNHHHKPLNANDTFSPAIAYLATYLQRRNLSVDYINSFREQQEELKEKLTGGNILTIAIITTLYVSVFPILEIMEFIKSCNQTAKIVIGGPFIATQFRTQSAAALEYLLGPTIGADIYVDSPQGEATLVKILGALKHHLPLDTVENIYYKNGSGYARTGILTENNRLSENPVDWNLFSARLQGIVSIRTAISCPFSCSFCGFPQRAGQYQFVGVTQIREELRVLDNLPAVQRLNFLDDTFNVPLERFKQILKMMIREKSRFKWVSNLRCHLLDREMAELMKESGCEGVFLGLESANNQILENMNKGATLEQYRHGLALLKEYEIVTMGSFIVGFPGETPDTVNDTVRFIRETGMDFFRAQLWYCEPITPIWTQKEHYRLQGESFQWKHHTMDSARAGDLIEDIFLTLDRSLWVPQYHFDYDKIWQLKRRGLEIHQVKNFLRVFNQAIKDRLSSPATREVRLERIKEMQDALRGKPTGRTREEMSEDDGINVIDRDSVTFNF